LRDNEKTSRKELKKKQVIYLAMEKLGRYHVQENEGKKGKSETP